MRPLYSGRNIFWLCVALVMTFYAMALHVAFFQVLIDPLFSHDSMTYLKPTLSFLFNGKMQINSFRTEGYPVFLILFLKIFSSFSAVLVAQHGLLFMTALLSSLLYWNFIKKSPVQAFVVGWLTFIAPEMLLYSHWIMTETLFTFFYVLTIFLFYLSLKRESRLWASLTGWGACIATFVRPAGMSFLFLIPLLYLVFLKKKRTAMVSSYSLAALIFLLAWSTYNLQTKGYFGLVKKSDLILFGYTAHLLEIDESIDPDLQIVLEPIYEKYKTELKDQNFVIYDPRGPVKALGKNNYSEEEINQIVMDLSFKSIQDHPFRFLSRFIADVWSYLTVQSGRPGYYVLPPQYFSWIGLYRFWNLTTEYPGARSYVHYEFGPNFHRLIQDPRAKQLSEPQLFLAYRSVTADPAIDKISTLSLYPLQTDSVLTQPLSPLISYGNWITFFGFFSCLFLIIIDANARPKIGPLLLFTLCHLIFTSLGGTLPRYTIPIQPLYYILFLYGINECWLKLSMSRP